MKVYTKSNKSNSIKQDVALFSKLDTLRNYFSDHAITAEKNNDENQLKFCLRNIDIIDAKRLKIYYGIKSNIRGYNNNLPP